MPHRNRFNSSHLPDNRLSLEEKRERRTQRNQKILERWEEYLYIERWKKEHPDEEVPHEILVQTPTLPIHWYIASVDEVKDGNIETLERAIHNCMCTTLDGRSYDPAKGLPWFVRKVRTGLYEYTAQPDRRNSWLLIGTRENLLKEDYEERLITWEEEDREYQSWKQAQSGNSQKEI